MSFEAIKKKTVKLNEKCKKRQYLLEAVIKSDTNRFNQILNNDPVLLDCFIPPG